MSHADPTAALDNSRVNLDVGLNLECCAWQKNEVQQHKTQPEGQIKGPIVLEVNRHLVYIFQPNLECLK